MISFDLDWYGTFNRRSAVADYLELLAIGGVTISKESLADQIVDTTGWLAKLGDRIQDSDPEDRGPEPDGDDTDLSSTQAIAAEYANNIEQVLRERADLLADRYPFEVGKDNVVVSFRGDSSFPVPYLTLLALTICHAASVEGFPEAPAYIFEDVVAAALSARGLPTACLGRNARGAGGFAATLKSSCAEVGLDAYPAEAPYRVFANEEGSDSISNWWPEDTRLGGVQFVGQATCARSTEWKKKLMEPPVGHWEDWLQRKLAPVAFLSVPHHVEDDTRHYLVTADRKRDVIDRIRLAMVDRDLLATEIDAFERMIAQNLEPLN